MSETSSDTMVDDVEMKDASKSDENSQEQKVEVSKEEAERLVLEGTHFIQSTRYSVRFNDILTLNDYNFNNFVNLTDLANVFKLNRSLGLFRPRLYS